MAFTIGKLKCYFCGKKDGVLESVCDYGIYGNIGRRVHYHQECLQMVEIHTEKCGHLMADKAIHINELRKECMRNCNNKLEQEFVNKIKKLSMFSFERMLPSTHRKVS